MTQSERMLAHTLAIILAVAGPSLQAAEHRHADHGHQSPAKLQLDQGKKWPTDEVLRNSMNALRDGFAERIEAIRKGTLGAAQYEALGADVQAEVANIVANCKLEPKADAMLHIVIADLLSAAEVMQGKTKGSPAAAARQAVNALNAYGRYFDHPRWKPLN
jgi:hypothetical protein